MIKLKIICFFLCLWSINLLSQNMQIKWQQCFGGSDTDESYDIIQTNNGYLIAGSTESNDGDISFNHGTTDGWLIKTDLLGNLEWEKTYGGSKGDGIFRIIPSQDNNFFLLCSANSSDGNISNDPYPNSMDYWIVKIDSLGNIIWDKIYGGTGLDQMWTGIGDSDGGVIAIGWTGSDDGDISTYYGYYDIWMVKLDNEGNLEWDFTIGTNYFDYPDAIIQTSDGGFLIGGSSIVKEGGNFTCDTHGNSDGVLIKLDSLRNIEWEQCYGGSEYEGIPGLLEVVDGYVLSAYTTSNDGDVSGWHGEHDIWVVKIDFNGNIIWQKCLGGSRNENVKNIYQTNDNNLMIIGETQSHDGDVTGNHTQSEHDHDIWMVKLSENGELIGQQCIGGLGNEGLQFGVVQKSNYNYVIAGNTDYGPSYDVQCTPHDDMYGDWWLFEVTDTTTGIQDTKVNGHKITVYPNPAKDFVVFEMEEGYFFLEKDKAEIRLTNVLGKEIARITLKDRKTELDVRNIEPGIYFYQIDSPQIRKSGKLIIP
jgi:Secretion system C-terminal sorting domain